MHECLIIKPAVFNDIEKEKLKAGHDELFERVMDRSEHRHVAYWMIKKVKEETLKPKETFHLKANFRPCSS